MLKAIIFDMDGVLINTPIYVWTTHNKLLGKLGKKVSNAEIHHYLGRTLNDQISMFEDNFSIKINKKKYRKEFESEMLNYLEKIETNQSLLTMIKGLRKRLKLGVATSSPTKRAEHILRKLGIKNYFDVIITSDDVKKQKPDPTIFIETAKKLEVEPGECLVVEDAANGIEAAKRGDMKVIALKTVFQSKEEFDLG